MEPHFFQSRLISKRRELRERTSFEHSECGRDAAWKGDCMKKKSWLAAGMLGILLLAGCGAKSESTNPSRYFDSQNSLYGDAAGEAGFSPEAIKADTQWREQESLQQGETNLYNAVAEKLIRTVTMRVQTKEFETLLSYLDGKIAETGGYIQYSQIYGNDMDYGGYRSAELTLRIPQSSLDYFISGVSGNATVVYKTENAQNVSLQYADAESRLKALQIEQDRFLELLGKAENIETILTIEKYLTELRYEIESYASKLKLYDNQVNYSTVNLSISEVKRTVTAEPDPSLFSRMKEGFINTFYHIQDGAGNFLVWFVTNILYLLIFGAVIVVAAVIIVKCVKKAGKRNAAEKEADMQEIKEERHDGMDLEK